MFGPGDLKLLVLHLLGERPSHGYELIKAIEDRFGGYYAPSPGAIYPTLSLLEEQDLIVAAQAPGESKKRFRLSAAGEAELQQNAAALQGVLERMRLAAAALAGDTPPEAVLQAMRTLKHALLLRRGRWTPAEAERVALVLRAAAAEVAGTPIDNTRKCDE